MGHTLELRRYAENGTTLLATIDLANDGAITTYGFRLRERVPSFHKWKDQWQNSPVLDGRRLVDFRQDVQSETITVDAIGTTLKNLQTALSVLNDWMRVVRDGQKRKNRGVPYISTQLYVNPLDGLTTTSHAEVLALDVDPPQNYFGSNIVNYRAENITLTLTLAPYWTASVLQLTDDASISNGAANYIQITGDTTAYTVTNAVLTSNVATLTIGTHSLIVGDWFTAASVSLDSATFDGLYKITAIAATTISYAKTHANIGSAASTGTVTGQYVRGTRAAPMRHKVVGGTSATNKLLVGIRKQGTLANFTRHHLWAKDATMTSNTVARNTDTTFDGNGTTNGSRTTAANTSENRTHRWTVTSNVADQYGSFRVFLRCRSNTAGRYSARMGVATTDGTNVGTVVYSISAAVSVGTDSGNALAWVDMGTIVVPSTFAAGATIYGLVYDLYLTCSNTSGSPTLDVDGVWLFPLGEGEDGTGLTIAKYDFGTAASGVNAGFISALPNEPVAYLANSSDVPTFPSMQIEEGAGLLIEPQRAARIYYALVDESTSTGNPRHDYTKTLTVSADYEVRYGAEGRLDT